MSTQSAPSRARSARQPATRRDGHGHDTAAQGANKENEAQAVSRDNAQATTKKSRPLTHAEPDEDDDERDHEGSMDGNDEDNDEDDEGSPVRGRPRRVSEKQAQLEEERAQAAARKQEKALKAAKAAKKKAGEIEPDTRPPIDDDFFTSRTAHSTRPMATKALAQRTSKVPPPPKFPSADWRPTGHQRDNRCDNEDGASCPPHRRSPSPPPARFRGRSPAPPQRTREPIRNINGGVVPDSVTLQLSQGADPGQRTVRRRRSLTPPHAVQRARSRSRSPRRLAPRLRSRSPCRQALQPRPHSPHRQAHRSSSPSALRTTHHPRSHSPRLPARLRSPTPDAGDKRRRSSSIDSDDLRTVQSQRTMGSSGRTRAKDLDNVTKEYTVLAIDIYRCDVSVKQAFPDSTTETTMVRSAWKDSCEEMGEGMGLTPTVAKLIASRGSQLRGELKTKLRPLIDNMYGFKTGQNNKTIAFNRKLAEDLKENSTFAFKDIVNKKGLYKNPIIQSGVNMMWFANKKDEGPRHPELFSPLPIRALALVLTAVHHDHRLFFLLIASQIENNIDERLTGIRTDVPFTANDYRAVYEGHVKALEEFEVHTIKYKLMHKILKRLHSVGRFHSGAQALDAPSTSTLSKSVLDAALKEYEQSETTDDESNAEE